MEGIVKGQQRLPFQEAQVTEGHGSSSTPNGVGVLLIERAPVLVRARLRFPFRGGLGHVPPLKKELLSKEIQRPRAAVIARASIRDLIQDSLGLARSSAKEKDLCCKQAGPVYFPPTIRCAINPPSLAPRGSRRSRRSRR